MALMINCTIIFKCGFWFEAGDACHGAGSLLLGVCSILVNSESIVYDHPFRFYGAIIPSVLNVFSLQGFLVLNAIIGGQTLASVSDQLNDTAGIVVISVISLAVTFCGYKVVHL
jgi:purine-cytosine permease-like protein